MDVATGFLESNGFAHAFDAERKQDFLRVFKASGLALYNTCRQLGVSGHTINHHLKIDPAFQEAFEQVKREYTDELEAKSRSIALTKDSATLERIFQLRALRPDKYARDLRDTSGAKVEINITGDLITFQKKQTETIETSVIREVESASDSPTITLTHNAPTSEGSSTVTNSMGEERTRSK